MEELERTAEKESSKASSSQKKSTDTNAGPFAPLLSELFAADLGQLQTNKLLASSSFDFDAFV